MLSSWKKIPQIKRHAIVGAIICLGMLIYSFFAVDFFIFFFCHRNGFQNFFRRKDVHYQMVHPLSDRNIFQAQRLIGTFILSNFLTV